MNLVEVVEDNLEDGVKLIDHALYVSEVRSDIILVLVVVRVTTCIGRKVAQVIAIAFLVHLSV